MKLLNTSARLLPSVQCSPSSGTGQSVWPSPRGKNEQGRSIPVAMTKPFGLALVLCIPLIAGCFGDVAEPPEPEPEPTIWVDHLFTAALRLHNNGSFDIYGNEGWVSAVRTEVDDSNPKIVWAYPVTGAGDVPANETLFCTRFTNNTNSSDTCFPSLMTDNTFWRSMILDTSGWDTSCMVLARVPAGMTMSEVDDGFWRNDWEAIVEAEITAGHQPSWCDDYY